jgi:outer membrane protein TolC
MAAAAASAQGLTREDLLAHALASSQDANASRRSLEAARDRVLGANSLLKSSVGLTASYASKTGATQSPGAQAQSQSPFTGDVSLNASIIPGLGLSGSVDLEGKYRVGLSYQPFADQSALPDAQAALATETANAAQAALDLKAKIYQLWAAWYKAADSLALAKGAMPSTERNLTDAETKAQAGSMSLNDLDKSRIAYMTAQKDLLKNEQDEAKARFALLSAAGYAAQIDSGEADAIVLSTALPFDGTQAEERAESIISYGKKPRSSPDLEAAQRDLARLEAKSALSASPLSGLKGSASFDGTNVQASLSYDASVISFLGTDARSRERDLAAAREKLASLKTGAVSSDRLNILSLDQSARLIAIARSQLRQAEKTLADEKTRLAAGSGLPSRVDDARVSRDRAASALSSALLDLELSLLSWD